MPGDLSKTLGQVLIGSVKPGPSAAALRKFTETQDHDFAIWVLERLHLAAPTDTLWKDGTAYTAMREKHPSLGGRLTRLFSASIPATFVLAPLWSYEFHIFSRHACRFVLTDHEAVLSSGGAYRVFGPLDGRLRYEHQGTSLPPAWLKAGGAHWLAVEGSGFSWLSLQPSGYRVESFVGSGALQNARGSESLNLAGHLFDLSLLNENGELDYYRFDTEMLTVSSSRRFERLAYSASVKTTCIDFDEYGETALVGQRDSVGDAFVIWEKRWLSNAPPERLLGLGADFEGERILCRVMEHNGRLYGLSVGESRGRILCWDGQSN